MQQISLLLKLNFLGCSLSCVHICEHSAFKEYSNICPECVHTAPFSFSTRALSLTQILTYCIWNPSFEINSVNIFITQKLNDISHFMVTQMLVRNFSRNTNDSIGCNWLCNKKLKIKYEFQCLKVHTKISDGNVHSR